MLKNLNKYLIILFLFNFYNCKIIKERKLNYKKGVMIKYGKDVIFYGIKNDNCMDIQQFLNSFLKTESGELISDDGINIYSSLTMEMDSTITNCQNYLKINWDDMDIPKTFHNIRYSFVKISLKELKSINEYEQIKDEKIKNIILKIEDKFYTFKFQNKNYHINNVMCTAESPALQ